MSLIKSKQRVADHSGFVDEDRPLEAELREMARLIRQNYWELYAHG